MISALIIALTIAVVLTILRIVDNYLDTHDQFGDELAHGDAPALSADMISSFHDRSN